MTKRDQNVMLRLTLEEYGALIRAKPEGEEVAPFARRVFLAALSPPEPPPIREAAAFIIAALSPEVDFDEALRLYDDHVQPHQGAMSHGRRGQ